MAASAPLVVSNAGPISSPSAAGPSQCGIGGTLIQGLAKSCSRTGVKSFGVQYVTDDGVSKWIFRSMLG